MSSHPQRSFICPACQGTVYIPYDLPSTYAPCPHCGNLITSPPLATEEIVTPLAVQPQQTILAPVEYPPTQQSIPSNRLNSLEIPEEPKKPTAPWFVAAFLVLALLGGAYFLYLTIRENQNPPVANTRLTPQADTPIKKLAPADDPSSMSVLYMRDGWKKDTTETLRKFIAARTPEEKANFVIGGRETLMRVRQLYGAAIMDEIETPADAFVAVALGEEDLSRSIFLMAYDRPAQFAMNRFFRPLASIEVQYEVEELDLLSQSVTHVSNFSMEPMKIQAFFKKTEKGMLLDWDVYLQTRHRTLKRFFENMPPGNKSVFRVLLVEDVPLSSEKSQPVFIYRVGDPAHMTDTYRVHVASGSETAKSLKKINWRGTDTPNPNLSTATVELTVNESGQVIISRLVCWEFAGLGGGTSAVDAAKGTENIAKPDALEDDLNSIAPTRE